MLARRIADADPQQEPVELRLGQRVRAFVLDRVLRREDDERRLEQARLALDRDLPLLHRLEQRGLRLRRSAVDLVGEQEVGEDRPGTELEVAELLPVDRRARHVRGHQVGRELDPREAHPGHRGERAGDQRLGEPGEVLDQHVAVREDAEQDELERIALPDDGSLDLREDPLRLLVELVDRHVT